MKWAIIFHHDKIDSQRSSQHKLYTELAWLYDAIYPQIFDYKDTYNQVDTVLKSHNCRKILEVACGTGRLMAILEENGYQITGLDLSKDMLDIARKRCRGELLKQDMRDIYVEELYDALLCLGRSFSYMLTDNDALRALKSFNRALREGGVLILDCFDSERTRLQFFNVWKKAIFEFGDLKITRLSRSSDYRDADGTWLMEWEFVIENSEKLSIQDQARLRSFDRHKIIKMLDDSGFQIIDILEGELTLQAVKVKQVMQ